jgi:signal transduction histidine kinase/CheY-like chemotaxis protein
MILGIALGCKKDQTGFSGGAEYPFILLNTGTASFESSGLIGAAALVLLLIFLLFLFQRKRWQSKRLEKLVQERTAEMNRYQSELEKALKAAEAANNSKSVFLANMSHEIRTPLNSIMGFSELALDGEISPKTREYFSKIIDNAEWLLQIINDILDISKIESGKMELENIPFDMHELFASCRALIIPKAIEKGIMVYFYAEPSIGKKPLSEPTMLRQALVNLLSNAIKFTNAGIIKILAEIRNNTENTSTIYFEVKDSGIGLTQEQIDTIYDPFTQAESSTTRKYGGTGLGLAITKNIIEMMGGKLSVESTLGVGSKFSFELTFDTVDVKDDNFYKKKNVLDEIEKPMFEGEVLLCEDNVMNQQVICEHLARVGLKTVVAENGKIGLDIVRERKRNGEKQFDLIFMDMYMPVMDGLEASVQIIKLDVGIPIIAMTANIMSEDMEIYRKSGMNDCVGKPFTSQELWRCLLNYLTPVSGGTVHPDISHKNSRTKTSHVEPDTEFQRELKKLFVRSNQEKFDEIVKALGADDIELAHRLAHTLKSNAGQIGKTFLQQAAAVVEQHLKDGKNFVTEGQLELLKTEMNAVIAELAPLLEQQQDSQSETAVQTGTLDAQSSRELFDELEPILKMGSPDSLKFTGRLRMIPGTEELIQQIEDFDFELAIVNLAELKNKI